MVFRERRPSRHRAVDSDPADLVPEDELESYLAAISPDAGDSSSELTGRFGSAQVFQVRLPALRIEQLRRLAKDRGVPPTSLVVDWVIESLDREDPGFAPPPPAAPEVARPPAAHHAEPQAPLSPLDHLNPIGDVTAVQPEPGDPSATPSPVTPLFGSAAHAAKPEERPRGPRHRAPEPVTSLITRRKF
jgi:hypothetical protein